MGIEEFASSGVGGSRRGIIDSIVVLHSSYYTSIRVGVTGYK